MGYMDDQLPMIGASGSLRAEQDRRTWVHLGVSGVRLTLRDASVSGSCARRPVAACRLVAAVRDAALHGSSSQCDALLGVRKP